MKKTTSGREQKQLETVAQLLVRCLENEGVKYAFGIPGEENIHFIDAFNNSSIRFVLVRHEQAASFMADIYGRLTDQAGVCVATLGPGAINLLLGTADANSDSVPLVAISAQGGLNRIYKESHQIIDLVSMFKPVTKWAELIPRPEAVPEMVRKAFKLAQTERPGAVYLALPEDVEKMHVPPGHHPLEINVVRDTSPSPAQISRAAKVLETAKRPVLLAGHGAVRNHAGEALVRFSERRRIPVATTFMGKGVFPDNHPNALGTIGFMVHDYANFGFDQADVILSVGYDMQEFDPVKINPKGDKQIIHIHRYPAQVDAHYHLAVGIQGDISESLDALARETKTKPTSNPTGQKIRRLLHEELETGRSDNSYPVKPQRIVADIRAAMGEKDIVLVDTGAVKMWMARLYPTYQPNTCIVSNGLSTMAFALPGAIAAKLALPDRKVLAVAGDAGFLMNSLELETAVREKIPLVVLIWVDGSYGMIKWEMDLELGHHSHVDFGNPDFVKFAESFGGEGYLITRAGDLLPTLKRALADNAVSVIACPVDYAQNTVLTDKLGELSQPMEHPESPSPAVVRCHKNLNPLIVATLFDSIWFLSQGKEFKEVNAFFCFSDKPKSAKLLASKEASFTTRSFKGLKLLLAFVVVFSTLSLPSSLSAGSHLPQIHLAAANTAPNEPWYPAGPSMNTLTHPTFTDEAAEFTAIQATPSPIDFTDWPLDPSIIGPLTASPNFQVTPPISDAGYFELQFHMGQNFWGCQFNYGNAICGTHIRQAFAHGLDKNIFISTQLGGNAVVIDNPVPPSVDLNTPDPCSWDTLFPQSGTGCQVNGVGGTAYHLAAASAGNCASTPQFPYTPGCGTPDFCSAADHLIAAGLASGKNLTTCVLTGISSAVTANPTHIWVRSDNTPRLHAGNSYGQFICALFTGTFSTGCTGIFIFGQQFGFPGFTTSTTTAALTWWIYTAGYGNVLTFDRSLFFNYDSRFVSGISMIKSPTGPCSAQSVPTYSASNYMYLCSSAYDANIEQAEFAPCLTAPGDPTAGQTHLTVTFANCPATTSPSSASAAYKAQDIFGQNAFTIPWWSGKNQFAYLTGWQRAILHKGDGFTPPGNFFLTLNAWNPSPPIPGTVRQGFKQSTGSVNPFITSEAENPWSQGIVNNVWDMPGRTNPDSPPAYLDWMTIKTDQLAASGLSYVPPTGTVAALRYTLRNDIFWQTGQKVTAWDLAFSYIALKATGASNGVGLAPMTGIKVLSPTQVDVDVNAVGPFTKLFLSTFVLPGRDWVNTSVCTASAWDAAADNPNFNTANTALTACIAPPSAVTPTGVITPSGSNIDNAKIQPSYDPVASGNLIGSGPWMCGSGSGVGGPSCSSSGTQSVPAGGSWTLTRYGIGTTPGGSLNTYFRSAGNLALWAYSGDRGNFGTDFLNFGQVSLCFGKPVGTSGCTVWQHGIGGSASGTVVGLAQVSIVQRFVGVNWVAPYDWTASPPQNIAVFPPVLHEGAVTLNPCSTDPTNGYDC